MREATLNFVDQRPRRRKVCAGLVDGKPDPVRPWEQPRQERVLLYVGRKALEVR